MHSPAPPGDFESNLRVEPLIPPAVTRLTDRPRTGVREPGARGQDGRNQSHDMDAYQDLQPYFGDIHNHCGISYGHGSLDDALLNAAEQLDFCSVTGHAHWPDMPPPDPRIQYILDFHHEGFARLKKGWGDMMTTLRRWEKKESMVVFPGFEIHMNSDGDRTILYKELDGEILYADGLPDLHQRMAALRDGGVGVISFPHHVGYRLGTRGINWATFNPEFEPVVELISMHGCSESSENPRPFLHSMGGSDWESTIQCGLARGKVFGVTGNTDHHSGHPGSYGHGVTGVWATGRSREAIWDALECRRTYALTGDRMALRLAVNGAPMGSVIPYKQKRRIEFAVSAGGAIDSIDIMKNNRLLRRYSECDLRPVKCGSTIRTKVHLELGWGERRKTTDWEVELGLTHGAILKVEPRFRGREVVSPVEQSGDESTYYTSRWDVEDENRISLRTTSESNPNNSTCTTQGVCLWLEVPIEAAIQATINGREVTVPVKHLIEGARTGHLGGIDSPAYRFSRAPLPHELEFAAAFEDLGDPGDQYYLRVRQKNDQWGWTSPVFVR
jgi:hypothetical protein